MTRISLILFCGALALMQSACRAPQGLSDELARPSQPQIEWQRMEYYLFVHFGPNTFTDKEWGTGAEDPNVFCPTDLDCRQWAATAQAAGMKGIIITGKHHDGFCLWPSDQSSHTVRESKWRDGKGDVLRELSDACREYGLRFGVYVSPWDRNHPAYGTPAYNAIYAATLREVLTGYGELFELWMDGANGEGPSGRKQPYDWKLFHDTIYGCQPNVIVFSDIGPGCRWIGNERGFAGETCWSRLDTAGFTPGAGAPVPDTLNRGNVRGAAWVPGESDVSIRPGWFYSPATDDKVKSVGELFDIYCASVGRNSNLLLNVPADRRGRIPAPDSMRLMELRAVLDATFTHDFAQGAQTQADGKLLVNGSVVTDANPETYFLATECATTLNLKLPTTATFDLIQLQEYTPKGQSVKAWTAEYRTADGSWQEFAQGTTIGHKRIVRFDPVMSSEIRVRITHSLAPAAISEIGLFRSAAKKE